MKSKIQRVAVPDPLPPVADALAARGLTQAEFAELVGTKQPYVSRVATRGYWPRDREVFDRWCAVLFTVKRSAVRSASGGRSSRRKLV